jgi:hypothetical protein
MNSHRLRKFILKRFPYLQAEFRRKKAGGINYTQYINIHFTFAGKITPKGENPCTFFTAINQEEFKK